MSQRSQFAEFNSRNFAQLMQRMGAYDQVLCLVFRNDDTGPSLHESDHDPPVERPRHRVSRQRMLLDPLTAREIEVLRLIGRGFSTKEIGAKLFRSLSTIRKHRENINQKLCTRNAVQSVIVALQTGIIALDELA